MQGLSELWERKALHVQNLEYSICIELQEQNPAVALPQQYHIYWHKNTVLFEENILQSSDCHPAPLWCSHKHVGFV